MRSDLSPPVRFTLRKPSLVSPDSEGGAVYSRPPLKPCTVYKRREALQYYFVFAGDFHGKEPMARVEIVAAVLTISDSASRGEREDGRDLPWSPSLKKLGARVAVSEILSDDRDLILPGSGVRRPRRGEFDSHTGGPDSLRGTTPRGYASSDRARGSRACGVDAVSELDETPLAPLRARCAA